MLSGKIRSIYGFHLFSYISGLHLNTIFDAKPIGHIFHGVWDLEFIECMLFWPYFYALDFYINEFTKVFYSRTLLMLRHKTLGLKWRPLSLNSFFATEWSLIYIPTLSKGEVSC